MDRAEVDRLIKAETNRLDTLVRQLQTGLRTVRGTVNTAGAGTIVQGAGTFTIVRNGLGDVTVTYPAFATPPSPGLGTNADAVTYLAMPSTTSFRVLLRNLVAGALAAVDAQFTFNMTGPAA